MMLIIGIIIGIAINPFAIRTVYLIGKAGGMAYGSIITARIFTKKLSI